MQNCETIVKFSALEVWEFHGLFLFHGLILDAFWDTSDCWKINILVAFLSAKYQWNFLRYVGKVRKTRIWHCLVASLIGLECAGDRSCAFLSELVKEGKVSVASYASILLNLNVTTILQRSRSSFGLMHLSSAIPWEGTPGKGGDFVKDPVKVLIFPLLGGDTEESKFPSLRGITLSSLKPDKKTVLYTLNEMSCFNSAYMFVTMQISMYC